MWNEIDAGDINMASRQIIAASQKSIICRLACYLMQRSKLGLGAGGVMPSVHSEFYEGTIRMPCTTLIVVDAFVWWQTISISLKSSISQSRRKLNAWVKRVGVVSALAARLARSEPDEYPLLACSQHADES